MDWFTPPPTPPPDDTVVRLYDWYVEARSMVVSGIKVVCRISHSHVAKMYNKTVRVTQMFIRGCS